MPDKGNRVQIYNEPRRKVGRFRRVYNIIRVYSRKSGYYKLYTTGLNTGTLRLYKDKDYTKIVKITLRWQKKMQKTVKMSP